MSTTLSAIEAMAIQFQFITQLYIILYHKLKTGCPTFCGDYNGALPDETLNQPHNQQKHTCIRLHTVLVIRETLKCICSENRS
jgi:hypothetical protein